MRAFNPAFFQTIAPTVSQALLDLIVRRISQAGPMPVSEYMALALAHPEHGYYATRDPFGAAGDFITAPEISQMFGELIGLWYITHWRALGRPAPVALIELGPGRGTLMDDALRAAAVDMQFSAAICLHFVESSPVLRGIQARNRRFSAFSPRWHERISEALAAAVGVPLVLANEFLDTLPVRQFVRGARGWHERMVGLGRAPGGAPRLVFALSPEALPPAALDHPCAAESAEGALLELAPAREAVAAGLASAIAARGGAALLIDYGYERSAPGDTLQALRRHAPHDVLADPGSADLTAHVDFDALARAVARAGAVAFGPLPQRDWLIRLGIRERAARLAAAAPDHAAAVANALERLTAPDAMGTLFKVLVIGRAGDPVPPGFEDNPRQAPAGETG